MNVIVLPLSSSFLNGTKKVIYFSVISLEHSNWPSNSFASSLIIRPLCSTIGIYLVFYILNYKYYEQLLSISQCKSFFCIYNILLAFYRTYFLHQLMISFLSFHNWLFLLHALLNPYKTFPCSLYFYNNQAYFLLNQISNV